MNDELRVQEPHETVLQIAGVLDLAHPRKAAVACLLMVSVIAESNRDQHAYAVLMREVADLIETGQAKAFLCAQ